MTVLVVQSHPSEKSFNEAILTRVISHLDAAGTDTTLIRLGKERTILDIKNDYVEASSYCWICYVKLK